MKKKRLLKNKRALSPVFSSILLIVIVVIAMSVAFAFFVNYVRDYQTGSGSSVLEAAQIEDVSFKHVNPNDVTSPVTSYVDGIGGHSNFPAQQALGGAVDTLTEDNIGLQKYSASNFNLLSSTAYVSGLITDLQTDNGVYMRFRSYPSAYSGSYDFGYTTKGSSTNQFSSIRGSRFTTTSGGPASSISVNLRYTPASGSFGRTSTGSSGDSILDTIRGERFQSPSSSVVAQDIEAYIDVTAPTFGYATTASSNDNIEDFIRGSSFTCPESGTIQSIIAYIYRQYSYSVNMKAALYNEGTYTLVAQTQQISVSASGSQWVTFSFSSPQSVTSGNSYVLVVWSDSASGSTNLYYHTGSSSQGHYRSIDYSSNSGNYPSPANFGGSNNYEYCIYCTYTPQSHNVKAALYSDSPYTLVAGTQETTVSVDGWVTFNFADPKPILTASTNYVLVVWSQSGSGSVNLCYISTSGGNGRYATEQTYGGWPSSLSFSTNNRQYCINCNYVAASTFRAQAAIYSGDGGSRIAVTEEKTLGAVDDWVTFNFASPAPTLAASTQYVLMAWASDTSNVYIYYYAGSPGRYFQGSGTYNNWPNSVSDGGTSRSYSIYCTIGVPSEYTCEIEFTGSSDTSPLDQLGWTVDNAWTTGSVSVTLQLFDYSIGSSGAYPTSGNGYISYASSATPNTDETKSNTITDNPANFRDASGNWQLKIKGVKQTGSQFDCNIDLVEYKAGSNNYVLELPEQWTGADYYELNEELWIYTGTLSPNEDLMVQVWTGSEWTTVMTLTAANSNSANQVSVSNYLSGPTFTIRFKGANEDGDTNPSSWEIDYVMLHTWSIESNPMEIWLYNYGKIDITISNVYINDLLVDSTSPIIQIGEHNKLITYSPNTWAPNTNYHIRIVTERGSAFEGTYVSPSS
jgi:flagellin-like protein